MTHRVVVVGGGFGGLAAVKGLRRAGCEVTLIDRRNHHLFQPLLYQVATAALAPSDIAEPLRSILARQGNATVRLGEVLGVDLAARRVELQATDGSGDRLWLPYDHLVLAMGVRTSWFGHGDWVERAPGLKSLGDALDVRRRILTAFEQAEWEEDPAVRARLLTFVIVGGGPTGVELAGAIAEIAFTTFRRDFRQVDTTRARVLLVEGAGGVLLAYDETLQASAKVQLEELGVEVRLGEQVTAMDADGVTVGDTHIPASTVLWAAGVQAPALTASLGVPLDRAGRVIVGPDASIPGHPNVFVIGDMAHLDGPDGRPLPGVAPVAQGMGAHAAACVIADLAGRPRPTFRYKDKGQMATIGVRRAILQSGRLKMSGTFAWLAWVFVHLMVLVSFRNRLVVFVKWAWAWLTYDRASRLIWGDEPR